MPVSFEHFPSRAVTFREWMARWQISLLPLSLSAPPSVLRILIFFLLIRTNLSSMQHLLIKFSQFDKFTAILSQSIVEKIHFIERERETKEEVEEEEEAIQTVVTFGESIKPIKGCPFRRKSRKSGCVHT